ncbi:MAG: cellulase family glycosylhydrolase [Verrucomicrobia bacterium]|nr:cellulase family glycosylhydrolase [Verrucomicrobiota bacterium]
MKKKKIKAYERGLAILGLADYSLKTIELNLPSLVDLTEVHGEGEWFKDEYNRTLILRGVNIPAKTPKKPYGSAPWGKNFFAHREVSFVDCPFPLDEADEHLARLRYWGFTVIRLTVTWEAIEHKGPGKYDTAYLEYLEELVTTCERFGINVLIDFHQDVFSRFTGGDGAPGWTVEAAGFSLPHLEKSGAVILHKDKSKEIHPLSWMTNAYKLAAATLFTLFFAGKTVSPNRMFLEDNIQTVLQHHYVNSLLEIVKRLKDHKSVIGFDVMNEPHSGYIGISNLNKPFGVMKLGPTPTPFEGMVLGEGVSTSVALWKKQFFHFRQSGRVELNLSKERAWQEGVSCPWLEAGVWSFGKDKAPKLDKPNYFASYNFERDFYLPFLKQVNHAITAISPKKMIFVETVIGSTPPTVDKEEFHNLAYSLHWYDAFILVMQRFWSFLGIDVLKMKLVIARPSSIRKSFAAQLRKLKEFCQGFPILISEFGIPFGWGGKNPCKEFKRQSKALNRSFQALEDNLLSGTVWNYTSHHRNHDGDHWNAEDLSIYSKDHVFDPDHCYDGARAKFALIRPYAMKTAGTPIHMHFDVDKKIFIYVFINAERSDKPTEIFLPNLHFEKGFLIEISDGFYKMDFERQTLSYYHSSQESMHTIIIKEKELS